MLYGEDGETLGQVAQRGCGCPLPASIEGQVGCGFEQSFLLGRVSTYIFPEFSHISNNVKLKDSLS